MIKIAFPDGRQIEKQAGITAFEIAQEISGGLARAALAAEFNGNIVGINSPLEQDGTLKIITFDNPEGKEVFWHSTAHIMAEAVRELYPSVKVAIGPAIDRGFYYDFDRETPFTPEDLVKIEAKMKEIIKRSGEFVVKTITKDEALKLFADEPYKLELINEIEDPTVTIYTQGEFTDLCRGPHIPKTSIVKAIKLLTTSGAYWRGDERNKMLHRIYGVSFPKKKLLDEHLELLAEAKKRDHRILGKELELFMIDENIGPGLVLWMPKGGIIRRIIEQTLNDEHEKRDYEIVYTPAIARSKLWEISGHADFYTENMFDTMEVEGGEYQIRPMNCPFHIVMYKSKLRSYRELPIRWSELGLDHRYERSGVLHGLTRVRGFTMDDAHIFCTEEQLTEEIQGVVELAQEIFRIFGMENFDLKLSTRPEKFVGDPRVWEIAEKALANALDNMGVPYTVDPGEGAFYGPKIDLKVYDAIGREWQCSTIQVDFNLPDRFDIHYIDETGQKKRPIMIHRAIVGSLERFFGILIEHYAGNFPLWLSPIQVSVLPISEKYSEYAKEVYKTLKTNGIRVKLDDRAEKIGYRIREAEHEKINYMFIVGEKEVENKTISIRKHKEGDIGTSTLADVIDKLKDEIIRRC